MTIEEIERELDEVNRLWDSWVAAGWVPEPLSAAEKESARRVIARNCKWAEDQIERREGKFEGEALMQILSIAGTAALLRESVVRSR